MAAIEKGLELPPEPLLVPERMPPRSRYLLRGLIWLGVGLAVTLGVHSWFGLGSETGGFGWIAVAIGDAYLIFYSWKDARRRPPASRLVDAPKSGATAGLRRAAARYAATCGDGAAPPPSGT